jgi:uncharacterized protein YjbJ (UPF0337 family)
MNQQQFVGFWKKLKTPLKAKWDKLTDEDLLHIDGDMVKFQEVLAQRYGADQGTVSTWANRRFSCISGNYAGYEFGLNWQEPTVG